MTEQEKDAAAAGPAKDPELRKRIRETAALHEAAKKAGDEKRAKILQRRVHKMKRVTRAWTKAKKQAAARTKSSS
ncbi:hypothetical protein K8I61_01680 [bacterium]|nr:hypothetical protein [bacterium]